MFAGFAPWEQPKEKEKKLKEEVDKLKLRIAELEKDLAVAKNTKDVAVYKRELELQTAHYKNIEQARKEGYDAAIKSLKEMRSLTS